MVDLLSFVHQWNCFFCQQKSKFDVEIKDLFEKFCQKEFMKIISLKSLTLSQTSSGVCFDKS
jgi:hypothetical protein